MKTMIVIFLVIGLAASFLPQEPECSTWEEIVKNPHLCAQSPDKGTETEGSSPKVESAPLMRIAPHWLTRGKAR